MLPSLRTFASCGKPAGVSLSLSLSPPFNNLWLGTTDPSTTSSLFDVPSVFSYLQQLPCLGFSCSSSPSSQFLRTSWKWDLMGLPLLLLFWDYWDQMFFSGELDQRKWERVKTRTLRKATESRDKAEEEWFLACNAVVQGIFGFAGTSPGFYRRIGANMVWKA